MPSITQGGMVKLTYLGVKCSEKAKRMARFEDVPRATCQWLQVSPHSSCVFLAKTDCWLALSVRMIRNSMHALHVSGTLHSDSI